MDISSIEAGRLPISIEAVAVQEVLQEGIELVGPLAVQRQLSLLPGAAACNRHVLADRPRLKQVLLNLLMNAVKYNRPE